MTSQSVRPRSARVHTGAATLSAPAGAALYIGALLGPGLLLLPGIAARAAGPASIIAWLGLLVLSALFAVVFAALGRAYPRVGGVAGYVAAGLGAPAGAAAGVSFLAGVVCGAPLVCLIGATYVTDLVGGGTAARCGIAAALLLAVLGLSSSGMRASAMAQLVLVALLVVTIAVAVAGAAPAARAGNWRPFAPHGWLSLGHAAAALMLSFVGWEAVAPLTGRFRDPARQLPKVIGAALAVTTVIYLGLAVTTIAVLGRAAGTDVPLAALLVRAAGPVGRVIAAAVAVVLTLGTANAYLTGAISMARGLRWRAPGPRPGSDAGFLVAVAVVGGILLALYGAGVVTTAQFVGVPTTLFLAVYLGCTLSAARTLRGAPRASAAVAFAAVAVLLAFCGWALAVTAVVALAAALHPALRVSGSAKLLEDNRAVTDSSPVP